MRDKIVKLFSKIKDYLKRLKLKLTSDSGKKDYLHVLDYEGIKVFKCNEAVSNKAGYYSDEIGVIAGKMSDVDKSLGDDLCIIINDAALQAPLETRTVLYWRTYLVIQHHIKRSGFMHKIYDAITKRELDKEFDAKVADEDMDIAGALNDILDSLHRDSLYVINIIKSRLQHLNNNTGAAAI